MITAVRGIDSMKYVLEHSHNYMVFADTNGWDGILLCVKSCNIVNVLCASIYVKRINPHVFNIKGLTYICGYRLSLL